MEHLKDFDFEEDDSIFHFIYGFRNFFDPKILSNQIEEIVDNEQEDENKQRYDIKSLILIFYSQNPHQSHSHHFLI